MDKITKIFLIGFIVVLVCLFGYLGIVTYIDNKRTDQRYTEMVENIINEHSEELGKEMTEQLLDSIHDDK